MSARLISRRRPRQREAAAGAARAGQQAGAASWPISFCAVGSGTPVSLDKLGRAEPRARGRGGRRRSSARPHNRRDGSGACLIRSFPVRFRRLRAETQPASLRGSQSTCNLRMDADASQHDGRHVALYPLIRPFAFALDAETAHRATIAALKLMPARPAAAPSRLAADRRVAGLDFPIAGRPRRRVRQGRRSARADARRSASASSRSARSRRGRRRAIRSRGCSGSPRTGR